MVLIHYLGVEMEIKNINNNNITLLEDIILDCGVSHV